VPVQQLSPLVIEEINVPDPLRVELRDDDLPHGEQRELSAWEEGGELKLAEDEGTYLLGTGLGSGDPIYHVLSHKFHPRVMRGHLRDHLWGEPGHADSIIAQLEQLKLRASQVRVTWRRTGFTGLLKGTKFGREDEGQFAYELTFLVAMVDGLDDAVFVEPPYADAGVDLVEELRTELATVRAEQEALRLRVEARAALVSAWTQLESALTDTATAAATLDSQATPSGQRGLQSVQRVATTAQTAGQLARALAALSQSLPANVAIYGTGSFELSGWAESQASTVASCRRARDIMGEVTRQARDRIAQASRLYRVQPGDTLDSVALSVYGSRGRALDLGLTQAQITEREGRVIRVPN